MCHFFHPNGASDSNTLVYNAFFGSGYPISMVSEFREWMATYECMWWPSGMDDEVGISKDESGCHQLKY